MAELRTKQGDLFWVDDEDLDRVVQRGPWHSHKRPDGTISGVARYDCFGYVDGKKIKKKVSLHRFILGAEDGQEVDHDDGNVMNNRKRNLAIKTRGMNQVNTRLYKNNSTGFRGVSRSSDGKRWVSKIRVNGKGYHLGIFDTPEEAHEAYLRKFEEFHGTDVGKNRETRVA